MMRIHLLSVLAAAAAVAAAVAARAEVRVFVQEINGLAWVNYECTAGEVVRAFALDVRVDRGQIVGISQFFRGESRAGSRGYGIFPASFRDHLTVTSRTNVNWELMTPVLAGAFVDPAIPIRDITLSGEVLTIDFQGGELEFATSIDGPWVGTGNRTGRFMEPVGTSPTRFYRVSRP